ncbi:hypothetical protein [Senegalimassilia anaerobia]
MKVLTKERALMYRNIIKGASDALVDNLVYAALKGGDMTEESIETMAASAVRTAVFANMLMNALPKELVARAEENEKQRLKELCK